jgi:ABC-type multidrug transport system fused ATPase/permease subunit
MAAEPPTSTRPWRVLISSARQQRAGLTSVAIALLVATALPLVGPLLIRRFIDQALGHRPVNRLLATAGLFLAVAVAAQIAAVVTAYAASRWSWQTTNRLREQLAEHALGLDYAFHGRHTAGEMIERVDGDIVGLTEFLSQFLVQAVGSGLLLIGALVLVTFQDVRLGMAFAMLVLAGGAVLVRGQRSVVPLAEAEREAWAQLYGGIEEHLAGAEDIRANGAGRHVMNRYHESTATVYGANVRWQRWGGLLLAATSLVFALGTVALLAVGAILQRGGAITLGTLVALFQYSQLVQQPVEQIVGQAKQLQQAAASTARVAHLLGEQATIVEPVDAVRLPPGPLGVHFKGVTFAYPDDPAVLHDIELEVGAGRSLGLVGRTGSGKTTIGRLLLRLYDTTGGAVEVGGVDVRSAHLADLRSRIGAVTQDVQLFGASVTDNLTLFADDVDVDVDAPRLVRVLHDVGLGPWFTSLPDGLDTMLGPGGMGMSAGEAQLLALSRIFLADPAIVLLDEPSSRLDPATEYLVEQATARLLAGRTAVVIAHRLASLAHVDDIAVLEDGHVVEHGPRAALAADPDSHFSRLLQPIAAGA